MNLKIFVLLIFTIIFLTGAVKVTDEDINPPLVSYYNNQNQRSCVICQYLAYWHIFKSEILLLYDSHCKCVHGQGTVYLL